MKLVTIRQYVRDGKAPEWAVRQWIKQGLISHVKAGNRVYLDTATVDAELMALMAAAKGGTTNA